MKNLLQKIGAILLCVCMLVPMLPETALAAMNKITEVHVNIELPKVGNGEQAVVCSVADDADYEVYCNTNNGKWSDAGGNVASKIVWDGESIYQASFTVLPEMNFEFASSDVKVYVNGEETGVQLTGGQDNPASSFVFQTLAAEPSLISSIELSNVPTGAIGDTADAYYYDGTNYTVNGVWEVCDSATHTYNPMQNTDTFQQGKMYRLVITASAKSGYIFDEEAQLIIDGENASHDERNSFNMYKTIYVNYVEEIDEVNILSENYPKAEIGKTFSDTELDIAVPAGSHYKASGHWVYMDENGNEFTEGTFESGKAYWLRISIVPEDGYAFAEDAELYIDDEPHWTSMNPALIQYDERVSLKSVIDKVALLNLPTATVGGTAKLGEFDVEVPADANYTATATWFASDGSVLTEPVFEENKSYLLEVDIRPNAGYDLAETLYINAYGVDHKQSSADPELAWFFKDFSFLTEISNVEITGYVEPKVGDNASVNLAGLKVPADANYEIVMAHWSEDIPEIAEVVTTFEKGKDYALNILVVPKEGYEFTRSTTVTLNGNKVYADLGNSELYVREDVSFKDVITEVQVSNVPTMEIGKTAVTDVTVPDGAKYSAEAFWQVWDDEKDCWAEFNGTFETGKVYRMDIFVFPSEGYCFSEDDTMLKVDGEEYKNADIMLDRINFTEFFQTEHKVIERVELAIEEPVIGNHASIAPVISIVGDANFTVIDEDGYFYWLSETTDGNNYPYQEYFVADENYGVSFVIRANPGYVFSEDLVIVINGKIIPENAYNNRAKELFIDYFFGTGTEEVIEDEVVDKTEEVKEDTDEAIKAPKTGDTTNIGLYVGVLLVGMIAYANAFTAKRRNERKN